MIHLTSQSQILLAREPVDFRKQIDGLCAICSTHFRRQPNNGTLYVFINRSRTMVKILYYEHNGYWLSMKRLSRGKFCNWPGSSTEELLTLQAHKLQEILKNILATAD